MTLEHGYPPYLRDDQDPDLENGPTHTYTSTRKRAGGARRKHVRPRNLPWDSRSLEALARKINRATAGTRPAVA